jgi:hypothetical protein
MLNACSWLLDRLPGFPEGGVTLAEAGQGGRFAAAVAGLPVDAQRLLVVLARLPGFPEDGVTLAEAGQGGRFAVAVAGLPVDAQRG